MRPGPSAFLRSAVAATLLASAWLGTADRAVAVPETPSVPPTASATSATPTASASTTVATAATSSPAETADSSRTPTITPSTTAPATSAAPASTSTAPTEAVPASTFTFTANKASAAVGDLVTYTVTVKNPTSAAILVMVGELFPTNVEVVKAPGDSDFPQSSSASLDNPPPAGYNRMVGIDVGSVPAASSVAVVLTVRILGSALGGGVLTYAQVTTGDVVLAPASVTCPAGLTTRLGVADGACATTRIEVTALTVTKNVCTSDACDIAAAVGWALSASRPAGSRALWRLTVGNTGTTALTDVRVSDADLGSSTNIDGFGQVSGAIWTIGTLDAGSVVVLTFETIVPASGTSTLARSVASANSGAISIQSDVVRLTGQAVTADEGLADTGAAPGRVPAVLALLTILAGLLMLIARVRRGRTVRI